MELLGALATGVAVFSLLMALFAPALAVPRRAEVVRAAALPREERPSVDVTEALAVEFPERNAG